MGRGVTVCGVYGVDDRSFDLGSCLAWPLRVTLTLGQTDGWMEEIKNPKYSYLYCTFEGVISPEEIFLRSPLLPCPLLAVSLRLEDYILRRIRLGNSIGGT